MGNEKTELSEIDFKLCDALFAHLCNRTGTNFIELDPYNYQEAVVILVWHASGIIGNGGFKYLFEKYWIPGDLEYSRTVDAFAEIGAHGCVAAFKQALTWFPNFRPPSDLKVRWKILSEIDPKLRESIDEQFFTESRRIELPLAKFIRIHWPDFSPPIKRGKKK